MNIEKPKNLDPSIYYKSLIDNSPDTDLFSALENSLIQSIETALEFNSVKESFAYAPDKWTVKQLFQHLVDCERILSYRVLCIARKEKGQLLGFDEDEYVKFDNSENRSLTEIMDDFKAARNSTISLLKSIPLEAFDYVGNSNGIQASARTISWFIAAHTTHHVGVLKERYV